MVYGLFAVFLDVLMIPFLRDSTSLENTVKTDQSGMSLLNLLGSRGVIFFVGVGNVFIACHDIPARARDGQRGDALVAGAINVVVIGDTEFLDGLRFALGSRLSTAGRYGVRTWCIQKKIPCNLLDSQRAVIWRRRSGVKPGQPIALKSQ
jgi:hypothetical protein